MSIALVAEDTHEPIGTLPVDVPDGSPSPSKFAMRGYQYSPDGPLLANKRPLDPNQQRFHRTLHWTLVRTPDGVWQVEVPRQHVGWVKLLPRLVPARP